MEGSTPAPWDMDPTSAVSSLDLTRLRAAYHASHATAEAVMAALLARMTDAAVWISRVPDEALLAQARKANPSLPLGGVPFAVKDNIDVAGLPTTAGCPAFAYSLAHMTGQPLNPDVVARGEWFVHACRDC